MTKDANYLVNISNVIDAYKERAEMEPKDIAPYFGVTPLRFKAIRERVERRFDKEFDIIVPLPQVAIRTLELSREYGLSDPEMFLLYYHFVSSGSYENGWDGFRKAMNSLLTGTLFNEDV